MEVPRLGIESELQLLAYTTVTAMPDPSVSATYTTAHGNAGSFTHGVRPAITPVSSWLLGRVLTTEPQRAPLIAMNFPPRHMHIFSFLIGRASFQKHWLEFPLGLSGVMIQSCLWRHPLDLHPCAVGTGSGISAMVV